MGRRWKRKSSTKQSENATKPTAVYVIKTGDNKDKKRDIITIVHVWSRYEF